MNLNKKESGKEKYLMQHQHSVYNLLLLKFLFAQLKALKGWLLLMITCMYACVLAHTHTHTEHISGYFSSPPPSSHHSNSAPQTERGKENNCSQACLHLNPRNL